MADVIGYPLAGLFVFALGAALPVAFWLDAATYVASAALLSDDRSSARRPRSRTTRPTDDDDAEPEAEPVETGAGEGFVGRAEGRLSIPAHRADAVRQHHPGRGRPD